MDDYIIRSITAADDKAIAWIIRRNLKHYHLDIPGTAYFDKELDSLSRFYNAMPVERGYFVAVDGDGAVLGGGGVAAFAGLANCAEVQKLYLSDAAKGRGIGKRLMQTIEDFARAAGYERLYLETHSGLQAAIHLYEKLGFRQIDKPDAVLHSTMNMFYLKDIRA